EQLAQSIIQGCEGSVEKKGFDKTLDPRLATVFDYLHDNRDRWVSAEECAALVFLSRSRFLHFFKEHTKCTFRRAQLWIRITHSMPMLKEKGLSETAFQFGFYDNAHYCRAFRENLGFSPQAFIKLASLYNTSLA
ncbi:MAG: AraC family transcriptional regulator, partial [Bacteroidota bacterium]